VDPIPAANKFSPILFIEQQVLAYGDSLWSQHFDDF
jgi:hypothetical protein